MLCLVELKKKINLKIIIIIFLPETETWTDSTQIDFAITSKRQNFKLLQALKAFVDDKINVTEKLKFVLGRVENIMGKGENSLPAFSPFATMF